MSNSSKLPDFASFASALRQTHLPGTGDRRFLKDIYGLASRSIYLHNEGQQKVKATAIKYHPIVRAGRSVLATLNRAQENVTDALNLCEKTFPDPFYWKKLFHPVEESLLDLSYAIQKNQQQALAHLHPWSLKKQERWKWTLLLRPYEYDYPLKRLGWKPAETWFLDELDALFSLYFEDKTATRSDRNRLTQAIYQAAFSETKELHTISTAISRIRKRKGRDRVK